MILEKKQKKKIVIRASQLIIKNIAYHGHKTNVNNP